MVCWAEPYQFVCNYGICVLSDTNLSSDGLYPFFIMPNDTRSLCITHAVGDINLSSMRVSPLFQSINLEYSVVGKIVLPQFPAPFGMSIRNVRFDIILFPDGGNTVVDVRMHNTSQTHIPTSLLSLANLTILELKYSRMGHLSLATLVNLAHLEQLDVAFNQIVSLAADHGWNCCRKLGFLGLAGNRLVYFDFGLLVHMPRLASLTLAYNRLTSLTCTVDKALAEQHHFCSWRHYLLTIRDGNETAVQPPCTDYFANLQLIDVASNQLTVLTMSSFESMNVLTHLNTAFNHVVEVQLERNRVPLLLNLSSLNDHRGYFHHLSSEAFSFTD